MATVAERISVLETQVENFDEKLDDLKSDVTSNHTDIKQQLEKMYVASCTQHAEMANKIKDLEGFKLKWTYLILGGVAVLGWVSGHIDEITTFVK